MTLTGNLVIVEAGGCVGLYVGGVRAAVAPLLSPQLFREAGIEVQTADDVWLERRGGMPKRLADVRKRVEK